MLFAQHRARRAGVQYHACGPFLFTQRVLCLLNGNQAPLALCDYFLGPQPLPGTSSHWLFPMVFLDITDNCPEYWAITSPLLDHGFMRMWSVLPGLAEGLALSGAQSIAVE